MTEPLAEDPDVGVEEVDAVPVLADPHVLEPVRPPGQLVVQAAAVAATSFVAGAATVAVVRRHRVRKAAKRSRRAKAKALGSVVASRSFLVDVHLLGDRG
jgi:hypothetical protein